jgi:hypothetical protein
MVVIVGILLVLLAALVGGVGAQNTLYVEFDSAGTLGPLNIFHYNDNFLDQLPPEVVVGAGCTAGNETCATFMNEGGTSFLRLALNGGDAEFEQGRYYVVDVRDDIYDGTSNFYLTAPADGECWLISHRARYYGYNTGAPDGTAGAWLWQYPFVNGVVEPANALGVQWLSPAGYPQLNNISGRFAEGLFVNNVPTTVTPLAQVDMNSWETYRWEWCAQHGRGQSVLLSVDGYPGQGFIVGNFEFNDLLWEIWVDNQNGFQTVDFPTFNTHMDIDWLRVEKVS